MPALTRRRIDDLRQETWQIYFGDVPIGTIGTRAGAPIHVDQWGWSCGFYPGLHPGRHKYGTAGTFEQARTDFQAAWTEMLPAIPEGAFAEWRLYRDRRDEMTAKRARGEKLASEIHSSMMRCVCGAVFDSWKPAESYPHRAHIYSAQAADGIRR